jgi:hypothetical protein
MFGSVLASSFSAKLSAAVPARFSELIDDPQILLSPERVALFSQTIDSEAPGTSEQVVGAAQIALADAITEIFLVAAAIVAVGLVIGMFMPRIQMRSREEMMGAEHEEPASLDRREEVATPE